MFLNLLNDIMFHLKSARPGMIVSSGAMRAIDAQLAASFQRAAEKALGRPIPEMIASEWILFPDKHASARYERRELLLALTLGEAVTGSGRYLMRMIDYIWAITEESTWINAQDISMVNAPEEDDLAFETGALLAWVWQLCGREIAKISQDVVNRIQDSVSMRILDPFAAKEPPEWTQKRGGKSFSRLLSILTSFLLLDTDDSRRWMGIRRLLNMMENLISAIPNDGIHPMGLEVWQKDAQALTDSLMLLTLSTDQDLRFAEDKKYRRFADYPVSAHLGNGVFVNPDGQPVPELDGETIFKIGEFAGNPALKRLGAAVAHQSAYSGGASVTDRLLTAFIHKKFMAEAAKFPVRKRVSLPIGMLIGANAGSFQAALIGGSRLLGHADAGNLFLSHKGEAVFCDLGSKAHMPSHHALPTINGFSAEKGFGGAKDLEAKFEDAFTYLLVNIAPAYPKEAGVLSWQRTVMLSPFEARVRIIEAYELSESAKEIRLRFITPLRPERTGENTIRLGSTQFSWEGEYRAEIERLENGSRIEIVARDVGNRGNFAFVVSSGED